ncbi:hypothetical protein [Fictibacillus gelatini]|uniref:hypothetical protein n=1 Tax=Fictibacillus gelatini TaxID=225985 RepID=UPI000421228F|nr:hypothetical protein [Fictibacillus gelatini]
MKNPPIPDLNTMTLTATIAWYTTEVKKVFDRQALIKDIYSDEYKLALLDFKQRLNQRIERVNGENDVFFAD